MGLLASERKKGIKEARKLLRDSSLAMHVGSLALAIETLECILIEKDVLKPDELMARMKKLGEEKMNDGNSGRDRQTDGECGRKCGQSGENQESQAQSEVQTGR